MGKRIRSRRRGSGTAVYRAPSHRYVADIIHPKIENGAGIILDIMNDPSHTSPVAVVKIGEDYYYMLAPSGLTIGEKIDIGPNAPIKDGNILPLGSIPEGIPIHNIELQPKDGGKLVRAAGTYATIVSHGEMATVQLPSGKFKLIDPRCRAVIGVVSGSGRTDKPFLKAGNKIHALQSRAKKPYTVRGVAMNAVNHPHGGGNHQHIGRPSTVSKNAPPGRKVGRFAPKRKKR
ncbi:MAG: 50S ribosomal protein L2 [Thermoplasmata archaeon]|nr:50S ribosomal protein L2 [Thermoplasmata archaeon]